MFAEGWDAMVMTDRETCPLEFLNRTFGYEDKVECLGG
jgi:hypothetical protein